MSIAIIVILVVIAVIVIGRGILRPVDRRANALEVLRRMSEQPPGSPTDPPVTRARNRPLPRPSRGRAVPRVSVRRPGTTSALAVGCAAAVAAGIVTVSVRSAGGAPASDSAARRAPVPASPSHPERHLLPNTGPSAAVAPRPTHAHTRPTHPHTAPAHAYTRPAHAYTRPTHAHPHTPASAPSAARRVPRTATPSPPAVSTSQLAGSGGAPVITGVTPSTGRAGQVVTLAGRSLFSANGLIKVSFGGTPASIACPTKSTCRVVVPAGPSQGRVGVSVTTASGTSEAVSFHYLG